MKKKIAKRKGLRRSRGDRPTVRDEGAVREVTDAVDVDETVSAPDSDIAESEASADFDSSATADESLSVLQGDDLREAIAELRRLGNRNGGYVTFDEMNCLLPQDTVDAVLTERMLKALEMGSVEVIREEDVGAWKKAKSNDAVEAERMTEDPIRLYMRQMGRVELLPPDEEERIFKSIEDSREFVRNAFCRFAFAAPMFARVLDQLEGQSVRFDHVVTDEYDGDRDAYISQIPEFRRMLKRARSVAAVRRSLDELCFGQKTLETLCGEVRERIYLPYRRLTAQLAKLMQQRKSKRRDKEIEKLRGEMAKYEVTFGGAAGVRALPCVRSGRVGSMSRPQRGGIGGLIEAALPDGVPSGRPLPGAAFLEQFGKLLKVLKAGQTARVRMVEANLRLVVSIVKKYMNLCKARQNRYRKILSDDCRKARKAEHGGRDCRHAGLGFRGGSEPRSQVFSCRSLSTDADSLKDSGKTSSRQAGLIVQFHSGLNASAELKRPFMSESGTFMPA